MKIKNKYFFKYEEIGILEKHKLSQGIKNKTPLQKILNTMLRGRRNCFNPSEITKLYIPREDI